MRDALATWHMGRVIYAYRTNPYHGRPLSQETVGGWLGLTQAQLSRIENGRAPEELTKLIRYAQILGIPSHLLWFALPGESGITVGWLTLPAVINGHSVLLPIDTAAAKASGLGDLLDELAGGGRYVTAEAGSRTAIGSLPLTSRPIAHVLPTTDVDELEHVAAALDDARRYLDGSVVDYFRSQLDHAKADDGKQGAIGALPLVLGLLGAISQHAREVKPLAQPALLSLGADGAEFAGWLYRDLEDHASATYWYDRAMEWAQAANDTAMQGYVLLKKSQMAYDERDAHRVATLARAAQCGPFQLPRTVRVEITQQEALGLAMLGESASAVQRKMDQARELLLRPAQDSPSDEAFGRYFTADTLTLRCAACYTEAGKPAKAAALFADVIGSSTLSRRDAGFFRARQATALALSGEPDEAASIGLQAMQIAQETNSERTVRVLADVAQVLTPWRSRPKPRELREALSVR
jgi:transcriptional regulator with XRE-family HTH domain